MQGRLPSTFSRRGHVGVGVWQCFVVCLLQLSDRFAKCFLLSTVVRSGFLEPVFSLLQFLLVLGHHDGKIVLIGGVLRSAFVSIHEHLQDFVELLKILRFTFQLLDGGVPLDGEVLNLTLSLALCYVLADLSECRRRCRSRRGERLVGEERPYAGF